ncbi:MAG TPA: DUF885 domain-containing protein [Actinomycetes bacterium]|nr:DUF885 domain-containing protein [Actinomycetes bacterium]
MHQPLRQLCDDYLRLVMTRDPFEASMVGVPGFDAEVPDLSPEAEAAQLAELDRLERALAEIDGGSLEGQERLTRLMLAEELPRQRADLLARWPEFTVDATLMGPQAAVLATVPKALGAGRRGLDDYLERCRRLPAWLDQAAERLRAGLAAGRPPTARGVHAVIAQLDDYLRAPLAEDPLLGPGADEAAGEAWRAALAGVVEGAVRPAMARYRRFLADEAVGRARSDDQVGLAHLPGGQARYQDALRGHTTTALTPDEVHRLGLEVVAELREEAARLGSRALGEAEPGAVFARLRERPEERFADAQGMLALTTQALRRAERASAEAVGRVPAAPCRVAAMHQLESEAGTLAYYQPPRQDGGDGGTFWLNVVAPGTRTRYEYEALTFHEAVPGHHLQIALAQELDGLPLFRQVSYVVAYCEGWALYAERLADELGLYSGDVARLGMVSFGLWRAARLVVDTGMHWLGWSRQRAVGYLRDHTGLTPSNVDNEIDRYVAWPGQACGYMVGCREILRLRALAERALGGRFDRRAFHDLLLRNGPLPLPVVAGEVRAWVDGGGAAP